MLKQDYNIYYLHLIHFVGKLLLLVSFHHFFTAVFSYSYNIGKLFLRFKISTSCYLNQLSSAHVGDLPCLFFFCALLKLYFLRLLKLQKKQKNTFVHDDKTLNPSFE